MGKTLTAFTFSVHGTCQKTQPSVVGNNGTSSQSKANSSLPTIPSETFPKRHNMNVNYEKVLVQSLLSDYDISVRPTKNATIPLNLTFGMALTQIIDVVSEWRHIPRFITLVFSSVSYYSQFIKQSFLRSCI